MVDRIGLISERSKQEARSGIKAVIYPESILGDWTDSYNKPWKWEIASVAKSQGIQIAIGANRQIGKDLWDNTLTLQNAASTTVIGARQTIPVSMYQPWHNAGYTSDWSRSTNIRIAGHDAMVLFCYEEHLPGIILSGIWRKRPEVIVAVSNSWWGKGGVAPVVQERHSESLAKLFGIPLLRAENT
ncbi:hypothetical protein ACFQAT_26135 [Undibacterium arcticum]|uniref:hypothetical protein n=1 Tax=Undibacterium arcticum TaxID=1762892 RepID=UPI0036141AC6